MHIIPNRKKASEHGVHVTSIGTVVNALLGGTIAGTLGAMFVVPQYLRGVLGEDALGTGLRSVPMVVGPSMTTWESRRHRSPIVTRSPIRHNGPMHTSVPKEC